MCVCNIWIDVKPCKTSPFSFFSPSTLQGDQGRLAWPDPTKLQPFVRIWLRDASITYLFLISWTTRNIFVLLLLKLLKHFTTCKLQGRYTLFRCGDLFSWWLSGEVKHFVHLIRLNLNSRLCPCGLTWPRFLWGNNARLCKLAVNWIPLITLLFHCRHQLVPYSVPNSSPVPLGNVLWGSGVCSVFVRSVSPCRLVLEVRLFPSPPCAVPALARRLCPLFSSSCLSGFTRSRPGVWVCVGVCV